MAAAGGGRRLPHHLRRQPGFVSAARRSKILSDGQSSRIYRKLVYETGIALAAFGGGNIIEDPNLFFAVAIVQPGHTPEEAEKALDRRARRLRTEPVTEPSCSRQEPVRARLHPAARVGSEQSGGLGHAVIIHNDIKTADGEFDIFQNLTAADVQRVARTYFTPENRLVLTIMPKAAVRSRRTSDDARSLVLRRVRAVPGGCRSSAADAELAVGATAASARGARRQVSAVRDSTLANGLQVVAVSHHEQPAVSLRLIVRAGSAQDPEDRPGVASLAATLLDQGTTTRSAEQIADAIDSIGGALGTGAERRPQLHSGRRDEGQPERRPRPGLGPGAASGVRERGNRAPAPADAVRA